eukprot:TRINITY_DN67647_c0_g1_i1.p2 TRINITY_DN67647_c0_g1~~TRINITY_DN67647_c0_g1_i1.p2  ORF type:complete len:146 (+),score=35.12 TRINITY_DN67647_c0_g1_i1:61-498(+)
MDALALLSDEDDEDSEEEAASDKAEGAESGASVPAISFDTLQRVGYSNSALCETEMYKRAGTPEPAAAESIGDGKGETDERTTASAADLAAQAARASEDAERRLVLEKAKLRDRKRAGMATGEESVRKKNARKMKNLSGKRTRVR